MYSLISFVKCMLSQNHYQAQNWIDSITPTQPPQLLSHSSILCPRQALIASISIAFPLTQCQIKTIMESVVFCVWFPLLNTMLWRFIRVICSFLLLNTSPLYESTTIYFSIHQLTSILGFSQFEDIMNTAVMNIQCIGLCLDLYNS